MSSCHVVEYIRVENGAFFPVLHLDFHRGHNDLIGEFGTGKSGVFHLVTYALDAPFMLPDPDEHLGYVRDTLGPGRVIVGVRTQHGVAYKAVRRWGEPPCVYAEDGSLADVSLNGELFKVHAYGAGALAKIAASPSAQLELIDAFAETDVRRVTDEIAQVERELARNAVERRRLAIEIEAEEARTGELASVAEALKGIQLSASGLDAEQAAKAHERKIGRGRERTAMAAFTREIAAARAALDTFASGTLRRLAATVEGELERGANAEVFRKAHETVQRAAGAIEKTAGTLREELAATEKAVAGHAHVLAGSHATEEDAYRALVLTEDADRARVTERERLHRRLEELSVAAKRLGDRRREQDERTRDRERLRDNRTLLYRERWSIRDGVARDLNAQLRDRVLVCVEQAAGGEAYQELLVELLQGSGIHREVIVRIASLIRPTKLLALVEADDAGPIEEADPSKTQKPARARKILAALRASERLYDLDTVPMGDLPRIKLKIGDDHEPSERVSLGQRCTCILPILLLLFTGPLLIDQPEDNIDNKFIFDVLVPALRDVKQRRQLIFATHNPNVVVLDPADRVFALVVKAGKTRTNGALAAFGDVDQMRAWIEAVLEGGRAAFLRRGEKYGHLKEEEKKKKEEP